MNIKPVEIFTLNFKEELKEYKIIGWSKYFNNNNPIVLEIGCGNGHFLINEAILNKNINYIGIDIKKDRIEKGNKKQKNNKLENIVWINGEAFTVIYYLFNDDYIYKIYMTFPDPWPKRRDKKKDYLIKNF